MSAPTADFTQLAILANKNTHRPIKMIIDEALSYSGLVVEWINSALDRGSATRHIRMYGNEYVIEQTPGNLRRLLHEMTHVAVYESYNNDGLNGIPSAIIKQGVSNDPQYMDQNMLNTITTNGNTLGALLMSAPHLNFGGYLGGRLAYINNLKHIEYDTTINEIYIHLILQGYPKMAPTFRFYQSKNQNLINEVNNGNSFFRAVESFARKAYESRRGSKMA